MKIEFSLILFLLGLVLLYGGVGAIETAETTGLVVQYTIQSLIGLLLLGVCVRSVKDE